MYFTSSTTWSQARTLTDRACKDLYGSAAAECSTFAQAWTAVGVN
jgi:Zn-dependent metalloprotease